MRETKEFSNKVNEVFVCDEVKVKEELKSEVEEKFITNVS